jgi:hypothetical protein
LPGFCDAHVHLGWIATSLLSCDLAAAGSVAELLATLAAWRGPGRGPGDEWIVGSGFDESSWREARLPTRDELDAVVRDRPVLVQRVCGHIGVINSAALARLTAGPHTDAALGRLAEDDLYAVNDILRPDAAALAATLPRVVETLHRHGITAVQDVSSPEMMRALRHVDALGLRVACAIPTRYLRERESAPRDTERDPAAFFAAQGLRDVPVAEGENPRVLGLKLFLDGSLGARTASLRDAYTDAPDTRGALLFARDDLVTLARRADAAGVQLMMHAIGDAALDQGLDALTPLARDGNPRRHRLEHAEVTPADLVERLVKSGVHVCVQPNFAGRWSVPGGMNEQRLGPRTAHCNAYRTLHASGVRLAFGSDCMPLWPLFGLRSAVLHPLCEQRLGAAAAIDLYTTASSALVGGEALAKGIAPGAPADLTVLAPDPIAYPVWDEVRVTATFAGGRLVHTDALSIQQGE